MQRGEKKMLYKVSAKLAKKLAEHSEDVKEDIYIYGLELIITTVVGLTSILLISYLLFELSSGLIFIIMFVPLRLFTGGYHATTYRKCFAISNCSYLTILILKYIMWDNTPSEIWIGLLIIASSYIAASVPVINQAQPISEYKQMRSKRITRYILITEIATIAILFVAHKELMCMSVLSICLVAAFILITDKSFMQSKKKGVTEP